LLCIFDHAARCLKAVALSARLLSVAGAVGLMALVSESVAAPPSIAVTSRPLHSLVAGVMLGVAEPILLAGKGLSHHGADLRPAELKKLSQAELVITLGENVDASVHKFVNANSLNVFDPGRDGLAIKLAARPLGVIIGEHRIVDAGAEIDDRKVDIHFWLSPENATSLTRIFAAQFSAIDPDNRARYEKNATAQIEKIQALDAEIQNLLAPVADRRFAVFHDALQYFEHRYDLKTVATIAADESHGTGARTLRAARKAIDASGSRCLLREPGNEPRVIRNLVAGLGDVRIAEVDPGGITAEPGIDNWFDTLGNLATAIESCLTP